MHRVTPATATATATATAAVVIGAIHVLDDGIVEPGLAAAGDHLASTAVPLVWLVALLAGCRCERAGSRATAHLVLGLTLLALGAEAAGHLGGGLPGDDRTGLPALAAGVGMVVLGACLLWRSRRRDGSPSRRLVRRGLRGAAAFAVVLYVGFPVVEAFVYTSASDAEVPAYRLHAPRRDVTFESADGFELHGWYVPSRNGAGVVLYPGRGRIQEHAQLLADHGYGVLLFDRRGTGRSEGDPNAWGWAGHLDVAGALDFLEDQPDVEPGRIGGLGLSVGGEVLLHTAAVDDRLRAVVSEGAGARSYREFRRVDGGRAWDLLTVVESAATAVFADRMPPPGLHDLVADIDVPVLFLHAAHPVGGEQLTVDYHRLAGGPSQLWQTPGRHIGAIDDDRAAYEQRVVGFLDQALLAPDRSEVDRTGS
jgi:dienelactone hydrolase